MPATPKPSTCTLSSSSAVRLRHPAPVGSLLMIPIKGHLSMKPSFRSPIPTFSHLQTSSTYQTHVFHFFRGVTVLLFVCSLLLLVPVSSCSSLPGRPPHQLSHTNSPFPSNSWYLTLPNLHFLHLATVYKAFSCIHSSPDCH